MNPNTPLKTLTKGYFTNKSLVDECFDFEGDVKSYWKRLLHNVENFEPEDLKNRQLELLKLLKENGVTYNVYGDTDGLNRPWLLDAMPQLIPPAEWRITERGLKQR
ncbi:MAG TPA: hypothetical protein VK666_12150, partial [Chryseolinea sp.]|nr:hypothetical protein [Chryseolinea sp.]